MTIRQRPALTMPVLAGALLLAGCTSSVEPVSGPNQSEPDPTESETPEPETVEVAEDEAVCTAGGEELVAGNEVDADQVEDVRGAGCGVWVSPGGGVGVVFDLEADFPELEDMPAQDRRQVRQEYSEALVEASLVAFNMAGTGRDSYRLHPMGFTAAQLANMRDAGTYDIPEIYPETREGELERSADLIELYPDAPVVDAPPFEAEFGDWINAVEGDAAREAGFGIYTPPANDEAFVFEAGTFPEPAREDMENTNFEAEVGMTVAEFNEQDAVRRALEQSGLVAVVVVRSPAEIDGVITAISGYGLNTVGVDWDAPELAERRAELTPVGRSTCAEVIPIAEQDAQWFRDHPDYPSDIPVIANISGC